MAKQRKKWIYTPPKPTKSSVRDAVKAELETKANKLVEEVLKPQHVKPPPSDARFNYIVDIFTKWHGGYFYFCATYACPGPNALSPRFETKFARLQPIGQDRFNLSFMRHTGRWIELYPGLTIDKCLEAIRDDPWFMP
jgi:hypothetical protein